MSHAINELIPFTYSFSAFHDTSNSAKIERSILALSQAIHKIPMEGNETITGKDPIVNSSLKQLVTDLDLAKTNFAEGHLEYARILIQGAIQHCFRCHTRNQFGPEFFKGSTEIDNASLKLIEQADLYVATRQYTRAIKALQKKLHENWDVFEGQYEIEQILKKYLAIAVRIKKDPKQAIETIQHVLEQKQIAFYLREDLHQWIASLTEWQSNPANKPSLAAATKHFDSGKKLQEIHGFQRGYIEFLRASSMLHDLLRAPNIKNEESAEIYLALGQSYETLYSLGLWELPEIYYEDCIRKSPKSNTAKQCYKLFERNTFEAYTGSAGTLIPGDQVTLLKELCQLAGIEFSCYQSNGIPESKVESD